MKAIPHVPNINEFNGLLDIFSVCNIMEASNIIHHKSYLQSLSRLTVGERLQMIHGRVMARRILVWIFANYAFEEDISIQTFYWRYLAHQLKTLCQVKQRAESKDIESYDTGPIMKEVKEKINQSFAELSAFQDAWRDLPEDEILDGVVPEEELSDDDISNGDIADNEVRKMAQNVMKRNWSLKETYRVIVRRAEHVIVPFCPGSRFLML